MCAQSIDLLTYKCQVLSSKNYSIIFFFAFDVHGCGIQIICIRSCLVKSPFQQNGFSQNLQLNGFSPLCILSCLVMCPFSENLLLQKQHLNGFSPECIGSCFVKSPF